MSTSALTLSSARRVLGSRVAWAVLLLTAIVLLVIGSITPSSNAAAARISRLDSIIKCPACEDLSIAQSEGPSSVTLRTEVATWVHEGWSDARIEQAVAARYGPGGLLLPPASGVDAALYFIPLGTIGVAVLALGWYLWRRRGRRRLISAGTGVR